MPILLASASPRRRELLGLITHDFTVCVSHVDEAKISAPDPARLALALAAAKARDVADRHPDAVVLGCDTVVDCGGLVFGKPQDEADVARLLRALYGRAH